MHRLDTARVRPLVAIIALVAATLVVAIGSATADQGDMQLEQEFLSGGAPPDVFDFRANDVGIDIAPTGEVFVLSTSDSEVTTVGVFSGQGDFIRTITLSDSDGFSIHASRGLEVDTAGNLFIFETEKGATKFNPDGSHNRNIGHAKLGNFGHVALDSGNDILYVADADGARIRMYDPEDGSSMGSFGSAGDGPGEFTPGLTAVAIGPDGTVYTAENTQPTGRVQRFDGSTGANPEVVTDDCGGGCKSLRVDDVGNVYVGDSERVFKLDADGAFEDSFPVIGDIEPHAMDVDGFGNVYVAISQGDNRVVRLIDHAELPRCNGQEATILGTTADDELVGTDGADVIVALDGDDHIDAGLGDDSLCGGKGDDDMNGGGGADFMRGDADDDRMRGGGQADKMRGNGGNDDMGGGAGADNMAGGGGNDTMNGNKGPDTMKGNGGSDAMNGNGGNDAMNGGGKADTINGGGGNDTIDGNGGNDTINGNRGDDTCSGGKGSDSVSKC